jgi:hypothetical protein
VKLGKSATDTLKCFLRFLENIFEAGQQFLNGCHISRPVECQLKMTNFVTNNNIVIIPHAPCSRNLASCDFALFPKLRMKPKGRHF